MVKVDRKLCKKLNKAGIPTKWIPRFNACAIDLSESNLQGSNLSKAKLGELPEGLEVSKKFPTSMKNISVSEGNLELSSFTESSLKGSNLKEADLTDADLTGAKISKRMKDKIEWTEDE